MRYVARMISEYSEQAWASRETYERDGDAKQAAYHEGRFVAYKAAAKILEDQALPILRALDNAHVEIAKARDRAELAGHSEAARVLLSMQAVINTAKALVYGDLEPDDFESRIRAVTWEAENYRPRG